MKIDLITILTNDAPKLSKFYREVLGFSVVQNTGKYVELTNESVRFAICERPIMTQATGHKSYREKPAGQSFELAFVLDSPAAVDAKYAEIIANGATPVKAPATMPWGMHTAFFADPDGNIHELFCHPQAEK